MPTKLGVLSFAVLETEVLDEGMGWGRVLSRALWENPLLAFSESPQSLTVLGVLGM